jgi:uroporphyrinogen III methyltransferase/synthase
VSSSTGALAYAGIPVTDRRHAASFAVVTGHNDPTQAREEIDWAGLATAVDTLIVLMGMRNLSEIAAKLQAGGRPAETPAAAVMHATLPSQRTIVSTLSSLTEAVADAGLGAPAAIVIGEVVTLRDELQWFEHLPLFGRRIVVTRQPDQAGEWSRALEAVGAEAVQIPMIQIASIRGTPEIDAALAQADEYELILLTSANAARELSARAREAGAPLDIHGRVVAVGDATAQAALDAGFPVERVETAGPHAQAMLEALRERGELGGCRVLLPRAERGREILGRGLREEGALVDEVPVYRTDPAPFDAQALEDELAAYRIDALTFASPSAVRNFVGGLSATGLDAAKRVPIAAIGPVTARACREAGLPPTLQAERPDAEALVAALESHFDGATREDRG